MQGIALFLAGGFSRISDDAAHGSSRNTSFGIGAVSMVFLFTFVFGATWLTVPWLYPAEIFPLEVRAKGNAWGVVGWSIGNGWLVSPGTPCFPQILTGPHLIDSALPGNVQCP